MASEVAPSGFQIDLMSKKDVIELIRKGLSNPELGAILDILCSIWDLKAEERSKTKAQERSKKRHTSYTLEEGLNSACALAIYSVDGDQAKWEEWQIQKHHHFASVEQDRKAARENGKTNKRGFRIEETRRFEDVERLHEAYGTKVAVPFTSIPTVWFKKSYSRSEILLRYLDIVSNRETSSLGTKRSADDSSNGPEEHTEGGREKRVCRGTESSIRGPPTVITGVESVHITNEMTNGTGFEIRYHISTGPERGSQMSVGNSTPRDEQIE